jgi:hypothetical protein
MSGKQIRREHLANWLAILFLLSVGIVWPPVFASDIGGLETSPPGPHGPG